MTADIPKKRRWFQIHLSTACLVMVVAGVLLHQNIQMRSRRLSSGFAAWEDQQGWPLIHRIGTRLNEAAEWHEMGITKSGKLYLEKYGDEELESGADSEPAEVLIFQPKIYWSILFTNSLISLAILAATAFACEYYTRRRERKQQERKA